MHSRFVKTFAISTAAVLICSAIAQDPAKPNVHDITAITSKGFTVSWDPVPEPLTRIDVEIGQIGEQYFIPSDCSRLSESWTIAMNPNATEWIIEDARPFVDYQVYVKARYDDLVTDSNRKTAITLEGASAKPRDANVTTLASDSIIVNWLLPCESNGLLIEHEVTISGVLEGSESHIETQQIPITVLSEDWQEANFTVKPGYLYTISIAENAETANGLPLEIQYQA